MNRALSVHHNRFQHLCDHQVAIGHDWGSVVVNRFTLWHPDRVLAVAQYVRVLSCARHILDA